MSLFSRREAWCAVIGDLHHALAAGAMTQREGQMARKPVSGFAEAGVAMAQHLDDNDLVNLFSAIGRLYPSASC
jgi:hypothetical protein